MSQLRGVDKLMESHGIKAVFIKEKQHCLRIVESVNSSVYQIGYVVIGVNGHCFISMTKAEQLELLKNEDIGSVETMPYDAWVENKVEMQKEIRISEKSARAGDPPALVAAADQLQKELGWKPKHSGLEEILASAWDWHRTHPRGYSD